MFEEWGFLKHETLTATAQKFKFPVYKLLDLYRAGGAINDTLDGIFAKWETVEPDDTLDADFAAPESQSRPVNLTKRGWQSAQMLMTFRHKEFPAELVGNVERAEALVAQELSIMRKLHGDLLDEYMLAKILQGSMSVSYDGQTVTQTAAVQSGNSSANWATNTTNIAGDVTAILTAIQNYGYEAKIVVTTGKVFDALKLNTAVKDYLARMNVGQEAFVKGELPDLFGLRWIKHDLTYKSGTRTRFLTEGKAIFMPAPSPEWTEFQVGKVAVGGSETVQATGMPDFPRVNGWASWSEKQSNPPGFKVYGRYARLPVIKVPNAVYVCTTGVT